MWITNVDADVEVPFEKDESAAAIEEECGQLEDDFFAGEGWE